MKVLEYERDFILDPSLVLYLPLWKRDGAQIVSEDRHGHQCSVTGAAWTPQGRYFDAVDDEITTPASSETALGNGHSLFLWVKVIDGGSYKSLWNKETDTNNRIGIFTQPDYSNITLIVKEAGVANYLNYKSSPPTDKWIFLGHTASQSGNSIKGFYNGEQVFNDPTYTIPDLSAEALYIGSRKSSAYMNVVIHSFYLWNRVFTPHEVFSFYLLGRWMFSLF